MSTPLNGATFRRARMVIVRTHPSELPALATENVWDSTDPYPGKFSGRFLLLHRDRPRWHWREEFYFCLDDWSVRVETLEPQA